MDKNVIKYILDEFLKDAQVVYDNYYCQGLSFNTIESEGYLRAVKSIREEFYYRMELDG